MRVDPNKVLGMWKSSIEAAEVVGAITSPISLSLPPAVAGRHRDPSLPRSVPLAWKCQHLTPASRWQLAPLCTLSFCRLAPGSLVSFGF